MKIALVCPYDFTYPGGVTEHIRHLMPELRARGATVKLLAPASGELPPDLAEDFGRGDFHRIGKAFPIPANGSIARITLSFHLARQISRLLDKERFDVIHYHEPLAPALPVTVLRASKACNVGTFHAFSQSSYAYYYAQRLVRRYFRKLHGLIAVSEPARDFVHRYFKGDYRVVPNGVDLDRFNPRVAPLPTLRDGKLNLLFLGRLEQRKGLGVLLRAYAQLKDRLPNLRLIVVGPANDRTRRRYQDFIDSQRIRDVLITGYVADDEKPRYLASADIFCAPNTGKESFGIVLLEAMASGVPVVATDIHGFTQIIQTGRNGILVRRDDPLSLASAIHLLASDRDLRGRLSEAGLESARAYAWSTVTDQILSVYIDALHTYHRTPFNHGYPQQIEDVAGMIDGLEPPINNEEAARVHNTIPGVV